MSRKPANLIYAVDEDPPPAPLLLLGLQHIFVNSVGWVILVAVSGGFGATMEQTEDMLRMSMIAVGVGSILQALKGKPVGSGYVCPAISGPAYVSASTLAGQMGGLPVQIGRAHV